MSAEEFRKLFESPDQSLRERWAHTALRKYFNEERRDFEPGNYKKDLESIELLLDAGYEHAEIEPIIKSFNAAVNWISGEDADKQYIYSYIAENQKLPPNPPKAGDNQSNFESHRAVSWISRFYR